MKKFNRQYLLAIQYGETRYKEKEKLDNGNEIEVTKYKEGNNELVIRPFFTIRFNIDRGIYSSMNTFSVFMVQLSHPYMTTGKTIALTRWTFVGK